MLTALEGLLAFLNTGSYCGLHREAEASGQSQATKEATENELANQRANGNGRRVARPVDFSPNGAASLLYSAALKHHT